MYHNQEPLSMNDRINLIRTILWGRKHENNNNILELVIFKE